MLRNSRWIGCHSAWKERHAAAATKMKNTTDPITIQAKSARSKSSGRFSMSERARHRRPLGSGPVEVPIGSADKNADQDQENNEAENDREGEILAEAVAREPYSFRV